MQIGLLDTAPDVPDEGQCELLGPFALIVQTLLGLLALSSLVIKRYNEYPNKRPWKVWVFDVSKQVIGALGIHVVNVFISILGGSSDKFIMTAMMQQFNSPYCSSRNPFSTMTDNDNDNDDNSDLDNPCDYYFLNIFFDTTIGIPILWFSLYMTFNLASNLGVQGINSGQYGEPPRYTWYFKQLILYFFGLIIMKCILYSFLVDFPIVVRMASWLLEWSDPFPRFQVVFVLLIFPLVMNTFQYYVVDNIIQSPEYEMTNRKLQELEVERLNIIHHHRDGYDSINDIDDDSESPLGINGGIPSGNPCARRQADSLSTEEIEGRLGQHQVIKNNLKRNLA